MKIWIILVTPVRGNWAKMLYRIFFCFRCSTVVQNILVKVAGIGKRPKSTLSRSKAPTFAASYLHHSILKAIYMKRSRGSFNNPLCMHTAPCAHCHYTSGPRSTFKYSYPKKLKRPSTSTRKRNPDCATIGKPL
jgi:hypothetical protein